MNRRVKGIRNFKYRDLGIHNVLLILLSKFSVWLLWPLYDLFLIAFAHSNPSIKIYGPWNCVFKSHSPKDHDGPFFRFAQEKIGVKQSAKKKNRATHFVLRREKVQIYKPGNLTRSQFRNFPVLSSRSEYRSAMMTTMSSTLVETVSIDYEDFNESFLTCGTCLCK